MTTIPPIVIIWCDISFENNECYQSMKDDFNAATTATSRQNANSINIAIRDDDREKFCSNAAPLITVRTIDEAKEKVEENQHRKTFVISSGSVGRCLVPEIIKQYPHIHDFYILAHNINYHRDWLDKYQHVKIFNFPTDLLLRLTRDISFYFIKQGQNFLEVNAPNQALEYFNHARNLEIYANQRDRIDVNPNGSEQNNACADFLDHLNLLEGENGLIGQALTAIHRLEFPVQTL